MIIYIASPYTQGDQEANVRRQIVAAELIRERGHLPFVPLLFHLWHGISPHPYDYWMAMDLEWLSYCDALVRLPGESIGADAEVAEAKRLCLPVFYGLEEALTCLAR